MNLTKPHNLGYSLPAPAKSGVQDWSLGIQRRKPLLCGFFMRKISVYHYVGLGKALFGGAGVVEPVDQPCSVRHHDWSHVVGFKSQSTESIMTNSIAISPEQFIFAQDQELKTTSLKVAEAFNKRHAHIIRDIEKIIATTTDIPSAPKFGLAEYTDEQGKKRPMYEMGKNAFMLLVMGYGGVKAMAIKVAYINAFDLMHKKLFPVRNSLVVLPKLTPRQQRHIQGVVKKLVNTQVGSTYAIVWGSVKKEFDVGTYKDIPEAKYQDLCTFLKCEPLEGELLPNTDSLPAAPEGKDYKTAKLLITRLRGFAGFAIPEHMTNQMNNDIDKLDACLTSAWTEMDEALLRISHATIFLQRWQAK